MQRSPIYVQKRWPCPNIQSRHWPPNANAASAWHFQLPGEKRVKHAQIDIDFRLFAANMFANIWMRTVFSGSILGPLQSMLGDSISCQQIGTQENREPGLLLRLFCHVFWNASGSEMTLKWLFDLVFKLSNPYILQPAPLPPTSTACTAATQKITLDQPMVLRPPYGGLQGSQWSNMKTQVETHIGTQNAPLKLQIAPEIWPCHKSAFFRVHVSFLPVLIYYYGCRLALF